MCTRILYLHRPNGQYLFHPHYLSLRISVAPTQHQCHVFLLQYDATKRIKRIHALVHARELENCTARLRGAKVTRAVVRGPTLVYEGRGLDSLYSIDIQKIKC